jgi:hypothetical protein
VRSCGLDSSGSGYGTVADSCEHDDGLEIFTLMKIQVVIF